MSIDFLEYLRLQFPWLVMPSTNPFLDPKIDDDGVLRDPMPPQEDPIIRDIFPQTMGSGVLRDPIPPMEDTVIRDVFPPMDDSVIRDPIPPMDAGGIEAATGEEERPSTHRWREWSPPDIPLSDILGHATDPEERQRLLEQSGITEDIIKDFPTGSLPPFITDYLAGGRKIPEDQSNIYDLLKGDVYAGDVDVDLPEHEVRAGLGEEIPLKKEFDPDDFISDFLESRNIGPQDDRTILERLKDATQDNRSLLDTLRDASKSIEDMTQNFKDLNKWAEEREWRKQNPEYGQGRLISEQYLDVDAEIHEAEQVAKKKAAINEYLYPHPQGPSSIPELDILREQQARLEQDGRSSINRWFGQNVFDRDPETEKLLDSKDQSGITDEAELFLRTMADRYMESGKFKPEEEPSDIMDRIWTAYQKLQTPEYYPTFDEEDWDRLTDEERSSLAPSFKTFDQQHWGSLSDEAKSDLIETEWFLMLEAAVYGQPPETNYFVQQGIDPPEWVVPADRDVAKQEFRAAPDAAKLIDKRWAKLSETIQGWVSGFSNYQLAQLMDGSITKINDETKVARGEMEVGEKWMKDVFEDSVFREVTNRFDDIMKRTTPPPLSGASGVTEYTTTQFPFLYTQNEMDKGLKTATWRKMSYPIARTAEVGQLFHYVTEDGRHKMYRITDVIEEKRWENVSKRWKEEGYTSKEKLAEVHRKIERMEGPHNKARWDKQSELFKEGKGIWHDTGKTIVFEEAIDLTDELNNLGAKPKPKPTSQERFKAIPREETQPTDIGNIPVHLDEEGNVDLSKAPSFKDLSPADQDPKTRVTGGFRAVDTTSGEIVDVTPSKFILSNRTEFGNLAQRRFNYRDKPYFSVEHAFQTWKNGEFNEKIYNHPLWAKPGTQIQEKYYPRMNEKPVAVGTLPDGTQVTLPGNVKLMYDLVFDSMRQNPEVLKRFLESSGKFSDVETHQGSFWEKAFPAVLEGVWKHLREVQPVVTVNVAGNREWKTPKHKEIMRKTLRAIKEDIEGKGYRMKVISGVQVGADQMGLDIAKELGLEIGGWAPMEWIVDGRETGKWQDPSLEQKYPGVKEFTGGPKFQDARERYRARTIQNVRSADFTIQFTVPGRFESPGARLGRNASRDEGKKLYDNPDVSFESKFRRALRRAEKNPLSYTISPDKEAEIKAEIARSLPGTTRYLRRQR